MKQIVVIITGLSGSGKSVALRALEDEGFFCVDNLPVALMDPFTSIVMAHGNNTRVAIGIDVREKEFLHSFDTVISALRKKYNVEVVFLEAEKDVLIRRFRETRRPHPLSSGGVSIDETIRRENSMLLPLRKESDRVVDTSSYTPHQLRHLIASLYKVSPGQDVMNLTLISFGYKFGIPQNIDLLFDVRFIPNPHFVNSLRDLTGNDAAVRDFVLEKPSAIEFVERTSSLLDFLIPQYVGEGKAFLTIGFGCTGGRHRSPVIVGKIASHIMEKQGLEPLIIHRDME